MSFRTILVKSRCKLEYSLNYLIYRGENELKICLDEISTIIIQSTQVSLTTALISELIEKKIKIIFCDSKSNPQCELVPYYSSYNTREKIVQQMSFSKDICDIVWRSIIIKKIFNQAENLKYKNLVDSCSKLEQYIDEVDIGDISNREGHAAKVYFNSLFGKSFSRDKDIAINAFLNYGYSIILSSINREIKNLGYLTEIGIHHIGETNPFNLSCDFMEPLRPLVDYMVISGKVNLDNYKKELIDLLNINAIIDGKTMILDNAIKVYVQSLLTSLIKEDVDLIKYIEYERL